MMYIKKLGLYLKNEVSLDSSFSNVNVYHSFFVNLCKDKTVALQNDGVLHCLLNL